VLLRLGNVQWSKTARITGILSTQEVNLSVPAKVYNDWAYDDVLGLRVPEED